MERTQDISSPWCRDSLAGRPADTSVLMRKSAALSARGAAGSQHPDAGVRGAAQANVGGDVLVYDVNSRQQAPGPVFSAADCCAACKSQPACNVWTFCPRVEGCSNDCPANVQQCAPRSAAPARPPGRAAGVQAPGGGEVMGCAGSVEHGKGGGP